MLRTPGLTATRRQLIGAGATGAGAVLAAGLMGPVALAAAPTAGSGVVELLVSLIGTSPVWIEIGNRGIAPFLAANRGIRIKWVPGIGDSQFVGDILAGAAPDVFGTGFQGEVMQAHALLNLAPYASAANVDFGIWNGIAGHWRTEGAVWGLPYNTNAYGMIVNEGMLDAAGIAYPSPTWDYAEAAKLWAASTSVTSKKHVYGGGLLGQATAGNVPASCYLHGWGGSYVDPTNPRHCTLDSPQAIAAGEWFFDLLLSGKAWLTTSTFPAQWSKGLAVSDIFGMNALPQIAAQFQGQKWDFWPLPSFPQGVFNDSGPDALTVSAISKQPSAAWSFIYWMAAQPDWQRWMMKVELMGPVLNALWPEYVATLQQYAPPLRGKNLGVLTEISSHLAVRSDFEYLPSEATNILNSWGGKILSKSISVAGAFAAAAKQINALETTAAVALGAEAKLAGIISQATKSKQAVTFPTPAKTGLGRPPALAAKGAVAVNNGVYTLVGSGHGISLAINDGMTFACMPWTSSMGTFSCRLTAIGGIGGDPSTGAKVGLMARGDLSGSCPIMTVAAAINRGVHVWNRPLPEVQVTDESGFGGPAVLPATGLLLPRTTSPQPKNYLLHPVWFRLVRDAITWTAYTSPDGKAWAVAGTAAALEMAGCWVGIWGSNNGGNNVSVVFDNLSFTPTAFYQVGG